MLYKKELLVKKEYIENIGQWLLMLFKIQGVIVMGGCSGGACSSETGSGFGGGGQSQIEELVKAASLEEANRLLQEGHVFLAVYWNSDRSAGEYILGRLKKRETSARRVGFAIP